MNPTVKRSDRELYQNVHNIYITTLYPWCRSNFYLFSPSLSTAHIIAETDAVNQIGGAVHTHRFKLTDLRGTGSTNQQITVDSISAAT